MKTAQEYEVKIRTEKHGVYRDHGPFTIAARSKNQAVREALRHLKIQIARLYGHSNKAKVAAYRNIMEDTIGSEVSIIVTRLS